MAGYSKGRRGQGLSNTAAIANKPMKPEPSDFNYLVARADPMPPHFNSGQISRNPSPDHNRECPGKVIDNG